MPASEEIVRELETFYQSYIDAFNREDMDAYGAKFAFPYAWVTGDRGLTTCATDADHQGVISKLMIGLKGRGWVRSGIDTFKAWAMADDLGMIVADATRYKADGSVLERVRACYTLRRDGKAWKIVTLAEIKSPHRGPG